MGCVAVVSLIGQIWWQHVPPAKTADRAICGGNVTSVKIVPGCSFRISLPALEGNVYVTLTFFGQSLR